MRRSAAILVLVAALTAITGCSGGRDRSDAANEPPSTVVTTTTAPAAGNLEFPDGDWTTVEPAEADMDRAAIDALIAQAKAANSSCLAITRNGRLVHHEDWTVAGAPREAFSVTKSLTSILVGVAARDGLLSVDDPAADYVPEWRGTPSEVVTIRDILANTSGREWSLRTDYREMALDAKDKTAYGIALTQAAAPGDVWAYNNSAIQVLSAVLEEATGMSPSDYAAREVFGPLGMAESELRKDASGHSLTFMGLSTTCPDLARMGLMMLAGGEWDGTPIVTPEHAEASTGRSSSELNAAYGWLWWLNRPGRVASPTIAVAIGEPGEDRDGQLAAGVPEDVFWALGFGGQYVAVIPQLGIVATRMGTKPPDDPPFGVPEFTSAVISTAAEPTS